MEHELMGRPVSWTREEDQTLYVMWRDNYTARLIALELGKTRSAVLGRMYRRGLKKKNV
jgi:hypothetical protein